MQLIAVIYLYMSFKEEIKYIRCANFSIRAPYFQYRCYFDHNRPELSVSKFINYNNKNISNNLLLEAAEKHGLEYHV